MKILYDTQIYLGQLAGGVSRYHYELLKGISGTQDVDLAGRFYKNQYIRQFNPLNKRLVRDPMSLFSEINKRLIAKKVREADYDIFHPAGTYKFIEEFQTQKKMLITIHDMIMEKHFGADSTQKLRYAQKADKIIAVSKSTKNDIMEMFGIADDKIEVIYHGSSLSYDKKQKTSLQLPSKYILFVGNRDAYKNFSNSLEGIAPALRENKDLYFICVGKTGFQKHEQERIEKLNISSQVLSFIKVDDKDLSVLYAHALFFIFPSLYEGFGIPILEAWSCGTAIALSDTVCFKEIAQDNALYFDPNNIDAITEIVFEMLKNQDLREEFVRKGQKRLADFSWEKTVEQTMKLYDSL